MQVLTLIRTATLSLALLLPASASVMDNFAGLPDNTLHGMFETTNGAAIKHAFTGLQAGDVVSFDWNYRAGDYPPFNDTSWLSVNGGTPHILAVTADASPGGGALAVPAAGNTGWQHYDWTVTAAEALSSTFTLTIGLNNTIDLLYPPWIGVDNFSVNNSQIFNGGFETGTLFGFSGVGDVIALQDAETIAWNGSTYNYDPASGNWFALLFGQGAPAEGSGGLGGSPGTAILPSTDPDNPFSWTFDALDSGSWVDPPFVNGFKYTMNTPGASFTSITFPTGPLYSTFSGLALSSSGCPAIPINFGAGGGDTSVYNFVTNCGAGVSDFTISAVSKLFDAGDPTGFPLQIFFDVPSASFKMDALNPPALPSTVPEPGTGTMLVGGLLGALLLHRYRIR